MRDEYTLILYNPDRNYQREVYMVDRPVLKFKLLDNNDLLIASYNGYIHQIRPSAEGHYTITGSISVKEVHTSDNISPSTQLKELLSKNMSNNDVKPKDIKVIDMEMSTNDLFFVASNDETNMTFKLTLI